LQSHYVYNGSFHSMVICITKYYIFSLNCKFFK